MKIAELYDGEVHLEFDRHNHEYRVEGEIVPSVTTITDCYPKPNLNHWYKNCSVDFLEKHIKAITVWRSHVIP